MANIQQNLYDSGAFKFTIHFVGSGGQLFLDFFLIPEMTLSYISNMDIDNDIESFLDQVSLQPFAFLQSNGVNIPLCPLMKKYDTIKSQTCSITGSPSLCH